MATLKKVKTLLNFTKKNPERIRAIQVTLNGLLCTDFESSILIKDNFDLTKGFQSPDTFGLIPSYEDEELEEAFNKIDFKGNEISMHTDTIKLFNVKRLERMLKCSSKDETRVFLNTIALDKGHLVAIDGHRMDYTPIEGVSEDNTYLMPRTAISKLIRICKAYKIENVTINLDDEYAIVENSQFAFKMRLIQRDFPRWKILIPTKFNTTLQIDSWIDFKELKPLLNKSFCVKLFESNGNLILKPSEIYSKEITIGKCELKDFEIGFNAKYLDEARNGSDNFEIKVNNILSPCLVNDIIVMPMKL